MQAGGATPPWLVVAGGTLMFLAIGFAIPAMTSTVMQAGGKAHASAAGAALNANRQVGALLGVAAAGTVLHAVEAWELRLTIAYAAFAIGYAIAWLAVFHNVQPARAAAPALVTE